MLNLLMTVFQKRKYCKLDLSHQLIKWKSNGKARIWTRGRTIGLGRDQLVSVGVCTTELT